MVEGETEAGRLRWFQDLCLKMYFVDVGICADSVGFKTKWESFLRPSVMADFDEACPDPQDHEHAGNYLDAYDGEYTDADIEPYKSVDDHAFRKRDVVPKIAKDEKQRPLVEPFSTRPSGPVSTPQAPLRSLNSSLMTAPCCCRSQLRRTGIYSLLQLLNGSLPQYTADVLLHVTDSLLQAAFLLLQFLDLLLFPPHIYLRELIVFHGLFHICWFFTVIIGPVVSLAIHPTQLRGLLLDPGLIMLNGRSETIETLP